MDQGIFKGSTSIVKKDCPSPKKCAIFLNTYINQIDAFKVEEKCDIRVLKQGKYRIYKQQVLIYNAPQVVWSINKKHTFKVV